MKKIFLMIFSALITINVAKAEKTTFSIPSVESIQKSEIELFRQLKRLRHERVDWVDRLNMNKEQAAYTQNLYKKSDVQIRQLAKQIQELHKQIDAIIEQDDNNIYQRMNKNQQARMKHIKEQSLRLKKEESNKRKPLNKKIRPVQ